MTMDSNNKRVSLEDFELEAVAGGMYKSNTLTGDGTYVYWDSAEGRDPLRVKQFYVCKDVTKYNEYMRGAGASLTDAERIAYLTSGEDPIFVPY